MQYSYMYYATDLILVSCHIQLDPELGSGQFILPDLVTSYYVFEIIVFVGDQVSR